MQKIATRVFIYASVAFGILGILNIIFEPQDHSILIKLWMISAFVVLPSFALSIAGKYLSAKS
jgi:hypothetical protein